MSEVEELKEALTKWIEENICSQSQIKQHWNDGSIESAARLEGYNDALEDVSKFILLGHYKKLT